MTEASNGWERVWASFRDCKQNVEHTQKAKLFLEKLHAKNPRCVPSFIGWVGVSDECAIQGGNDDYHWSVIIPELNGLIDLTFFIDGKVHGIGEFFELECIDKVSEFVDRHFDTSHART